MKIVELIKKYPDKTAHFIVGLLLAQIMFLLPLYYVPYLNFYSIPVAVAIIGYFKEMYDIFVKNSKLDVYDLLFTTIGGLIGFLVFLAFLKIYNL